MLQYESDDTYSFYLASGKKIFLTENDISEIITGSFDAGIIEDIIPLTNESYAMYLQQLLISRGIDFLPCKLKQTKKKAKIPRPYHSKEHIVQLVDRYYDKSNSELNTYRKVFVKVANELNITPKAVDKAYYSK